MSEFVLKKVGTRSATWLIAIDDDTAHVFLTQANFAGLPDNHALKDVLTASYDSVEVFAAALAEIGFSIWPTSISFTPLQVIAWYFRLTDSKPEIGIIPDRFCSIMVKLSDDYSASR